MDFAVFKRIIFILVVDPVQFLNFKSFQIFLIFQKPSVLRQKKHIILIHEFGKLPKSYWLYTGYVSFTLKTLLLI